MTVPTIGVVRALTGSPDRPVVDVERRLAMPPAEVWDALVQPERLARWLGTIESGERPPVGGAFGLRLGDEPGDRADCRLLECDPERGIAIAWRWTGEPDSVVRVTVDAVEGGSVLRLRHELVAPQPVPDYGAGWEAHLDGLGDDLAGLAPRPFAMPAHETWTRIADGVLEVGRDVAAPIDAVWAAFASAEGLRTWWWRHWADTTIEADVRPGGALRIAAPAAGIVLTGEVLTASDHHLAATWTWTDADGTSADEAFDVRLTATDAGTRVTVRHSGPWADDAPAESYRQGWEFVLGELAAVVGA
ncbi:SRPBCC family protein [Agrococcus jejuensis]|uniref:Uncharacterized conserved protein YndB, AHSA1/START domain n=1 Tax=Agrococcus jejuensis TaxID=399736 RepID=A0A1G8DLH1_9MICO|nr:SRPBCC family protein [Agrococcus jejuensis]SDH58445.1 Uncharacterized conserved protein YndB, AHSA1/START domain [Agrococcus jejuensis]